MKKGYKFYKGDFVRLGMHEPPIEGHVIAIGISKFNRKTYVFFENNLGYICHGPYDEITVLNARRQKKRLFTDLLRQGGTGTP